jgi:hypothetical protein
VTSVELDPRARAIHVKGSAIAARLRYVRETHGEAASAMLLGALEPAHRQLVDDNILPSAWVPYTLFVDLNVTADRLFGVSDLQLCYAMGRYSAEVNLPTLYKLFYKLGSPLFIFDKAASVWDLHYDSGKLVPVPEAPDAVRLKLLAFGAPHRAHCLSVLGWAVKSAELSGAEIRYAEEERCRTRGDAACEIAIRWRK